MYTTLKIVMSGDLNGTGTLFGGKALAMLDEAAGAYVSLLLKTTKIVTAHMAEINFISPAFLNEIVGISCSLKKLGNTSITVSANIKNMMTGKIILEIDNITFVHMGDDFKPSPLPLTADQRISIMEKEFRG